MPIWAKWVLQVSVATLIRMTILWQLHPRLTRFSEWPHSLNWVSAVHILSWSFVWFTWLDKYIIYRIHLIATPGFYFSKWVFGWGSIQKNPSKSGLFDQKVGVYSRKTPKTGLFTLPGDLFKSGAAIKRMQYCNDIFVIMQ